MNARARRLRQTMTTALQRQLRPRPSLFISATEYRNANRIVPSVARGGRNYDSRAWKRWWCCSSTGTIVLPRWNEEREGKGKEGPRGRERRKGKGRKLINSNHRAPIPRRAKDRSARLRLTASATVSFVIRSEKPGEVARACAQNDDSARSPAPEIFRGFHSVECVRFHPWRDRPSPKLTCAIKIPSRYVSGDAKGTVGIGRKG